MTFEYNGLVWFQTIGLKETAVSDQSRFQANGGAVYNTPDSETWIKYFFTNLDFFMISTVLEVTMIVFRLGQAV